MTIPDMSLIPIDDLVKEVESRCVSFICAYETYKEEKKLSMFWYGKGTWYEATRLANILNNDCLNNWDGELRTLQRLNEDRNHNE